MDDQNPKEESIFDVLSTKLQLDEMYGQNLASLFLVAKLLPALVEIGVFTATQAETIIARAAASLEASIDPDPNRSDPSTVRKYAHKAFDDFRKGVRAVGEDSK
jgi:hypothetical protein